VARVALNEYQIENQGEGTALLRAEAGVSWPLLLLNLAQLGWGGLEFGAGIPGTLGGGVLSNAGAHNSDLGQVLEWLEVLDARGSNLEAEDQITYPILRHYQRDELDLGYRQSRFRQRTHTHFDERGQLILPSRSLIEPAEIIMLMGIRLHQADPERLRAVLAEYKRLRKLTEPPPHRAGTIFKDPPGNDAGRLIAQAGLQGKTHGQAQISTAHANYMVNLGGAQASDVAALIMEAHQRVLERFGVQLELDVELRGEWEIR
jgi:UDP-N-acetylmuramate dehydrogenase